MPAIKSVLYAKSPFEFVHGDAKITGELFLEPIGADEKYIALDDAAREIAYKTNKVAQALNTELAALAMPKDPGEPAFLAFRAEVQRQLEEIILTFPPAGSGEPLDEAKVQEAVNTAFAALENFSQACLPTDEELAATEAAVVARVGAIRTQLADLRKELHLNRCARLAMLIASWDATLTDEAGSPEAPRVAETFAPWAPDTVERFLLEAVGKVKGL